ncbi:MAG TPA: DUF6496 domain-containing protein [Stellaceae bacterium]|nr:DUF6496 domain-containing protein [Stellaceae bacterium]
MASPRQRRKVKRVMHEYKRGKLKGGRGRRGEVKSRRQAIAIAMSESGQSRRRRGRKSSTRSRRRSTTRRKSSTSRRTTRRRNTRGRGPKRAS